MHSLLYSQHHVADYTRSGQCWTSRNSIGGVFISRNKPATSLRNRSVGDEKLYKWVLGETKNGKHCADCISRAGKVKSIAEWKGMGKPKCKCKCRLVPILKD
jgi:hypothetical protein